MITKNNILLFIMIALSSNSAFGLSWSFPFRYGWIALKWAFHEYRPSTVAETKGWLQTIREENGKALAEVRQIVQKTDAKAEKFSDQTVRAEKKANRIQALAQEIQADHAIIKETVDATHTIINEAHMLHQKSKADLAKVTCALTILQRQEALNKAALEEMKAKSEERMEKITKIEENYRIILPLLKTRTAYVTHHTCATSLIHPAASLSSKLCASETLDLD
jgi:hypothetical protein